MLDGIELAAQHQFAGFFARLALPLPLGQRPVISKAGDAHGLTQQGFLRGSRNQCDPMAQHDPHSMASIAHLRKLAAHQRVAILDIETLSHVTVARHSRLYDPRKTAGRITPHLPAGSLAQRGPSLLPVASRSGRQEATARTATPPVRSLPPGQALHFT